MTYSSRTIQECFGVLANIGCTGPVEDVDPITVCFYLSAVFTMQKCRDYKHFTLLVTKWLWSASLSMGSVRSVSPWVIAKGSVAHSLVPM